MKKRTRLKLFKIINPKGEVIGTEEVITAEQAVEYHSIRLGLRPSTLAKQGYTAIKTRRKTPTPPQGASK